ncbi:MAG TPA: DinB family protein [Actinospica sp.]|nr:DinB family protein [Actinospica sp.]
MVTEDVLQTFEDVRSRLFRRLEGLGDAEYLWEPVPDCMTLRMSEDGVYRADPRPRSEPKVAPFTTIAWRMWHIGADCLRSYGRFFTGARDEEWYEWPGSAKEGIELLAADWSRFIGQVEAVGDERLLQPMGELGGRYGHESYLLLALHALDEVAHHGAEIGTLRDLYQHGYGSAG